MSIVMFILFLIVAAVCAALAEKLVPNTVPGGFFTSAIVGIIGAWYKHNLHNILHFLLLLAHEKYDEYRHSTGR